MFKDFYGIYKDARNASWNFLIHNHITSLPVDLKSVTGSLGIKVRFDNVGILEPNQRGLTMTDMNVTYIIINKEGSLAENRYTIMHELGHIYLGHPMINNKYARTFDLNTKQKDSQ